MSQDLRDLDKNYTTDEDGYNWLVDDEGQPITVSGHRMPGPARKRSDDEWLSYDGSQGYCELCGSLTCQGGCFK